MEQRSPEWFKARTNRVTGSIVGAILGVAPYMTRVDAMRMLVRQREGAEREFKGNIATEWGTNNETGAVVEFEMEAGLTVTPAPFVPYEDWLGASPDGYTSDDGLLEVKCPYGLRHDQPPVPFKSAEDQPHYYAQMQIQMLCTGRRHTWFYQWTPYDTRTERVEYSQEWIDVHLPVLAQFHAEFLAEPADDHLAPPRVEIDTPEAHKMVQEWDELAEQLERVTERKKDLLAQMVAMAGEKNAIIAGRKLTLTRKQGAISYGKAIKALLPNADLEPYRGKPSDYWSVR